MKRVNTILIVTLLAVVIVESKGQRQTAINDLITVDVTKSYNTKKELILQDFMDVEYIVLETNDEFLNQGVVMDVGKKFIIVRNKINDGDIFVYDRMGNALRIINHKGQQTDKEYTNIIDITLDEDNNEMFVNDPYTRRFLVYDLYGNFKRSFKYNFGKLTTLKSTENQFYNSVINYDKDNLICYIQNNEEGKAFVLISKKDGSITHEMIIPYKEKISVRIISRGPTTQVGPNQYYTTATGVTPGRYRNIVLFKGNWMLLDLSSDTVYTFMPDYSLRPSFVRTPSIQSMNQRIFLLLSFFSDRYFFMETMTMEYDLKTRTGFPKTPFMYDRQEKVFLKYTVYNGDYSTKKEINMGSLRPVNHEIESLQVLEAYQLVESYKKGELKDGKLKEIASKLDEEDNPVIMLVKHKK